MKEKIFKNTRFIIAGLLLLFCTACDEIKDATSKSVEVTPTASFTISGTRSGAAINTKASNIVTLFQTSITTGIHSKLHDIGFTYDNVRGMNLKEVTLVAKEPSNYDMKGFIGSKIYLGSQDLVAEAVSSKGNKLTCRITKGNLEKYIREDNILITVKGPRLTDVSYLRGEIKFKIELKVTPL